MLIAAWAVGIATHLHLPARRVPRLPRACSRPSWPQLRADPPIAGMPEIILRRGAGAYICGEESAMIESIEGKRGMPRLRPPYVAQVGLFGRPTLEHNFETLYWVRDISRRAAPGSPRTAATAARACVRSRSRAASREPGVKLAPAGITIQELIDEYCGGMLAGTRFYAYLPGGASGGILPASMNDIPLDFDTLQPYGCFIGSAAVDRAVRPRHAPSTRRAT